MCEGRITRGVSGLRNPAVDEGGPSRREPPTRLLTNGEAGANPADEMSPPQGKREAGPVESLGVSVRVRTRGGKTKTGNGVRGS